MKQDKQFDEIEQAMKPGVITVAGFLGNDRRKLSEIIEDDNIAVARLGLSHSEIAGKMKEFRDTGKKGLGFSDIDTGGHFTVQLDAAMGKILCPFMHSGRFPKITIIVINRNLRKQVTFSDLSIHMIEQHGFYGGSGSVFRCDPSVLTEVLEIGMENRSGRKPAL